MFNIEFNKKSNQEYEISIHQSDKYLIDEFAHLMAFQIQWENPVSLQKQGDKYVQSDSTTKLSDDHEMIICYDEADIEWFDGWSIDQIVYSVKESLEELLSENQFLKAE